MGSLAPVDVTPAGDGTGRLFVVEQAGTDPDRARRAPWSTSPSSTSPIGSRSGGERGLLGLAFHPDYPTDPRFFVDYTDRAGDTVIASFRVARGSGGGGSGQRVVILQIDQPFANHNGGAVAFGPDGMLYIGMGDGGSAGDPQGNGRKLEHAARQDPADRRRRRTARPRTRSRPTTRSWTCRRARPEIWSTGMRNPWRMRFDRATGDLWIGDVGQGRGRRSMSCGPVSAALDFGWNTMEGFALLPAGRGLRDRRA